MMVKCDPKMALGIYLAMLCVGKSRDEAKDIMKSYIAETKGENDADDD